MRSKSIYFTLTILLSAISGILCSKEEYYPLFQDSKNLENCNYESCCPCPSKNSFFIRGDALYWTPRVTGLELDFGRTSIVENIVDSTQIFITREEDLDPHFKWDAGYRAGAGYESNNWGMEALWTHFQSSGKRSNKQLFERRDEGKVNIKFDQIDVVFLYNYKATCLLTLKPFFGVRASKINEHVKGISFTDITFNSLPALETRTFNDKQKYWGIGPLFGVQGNWEIGSGFGIYGNVGASLLYGEYKINYKDTDIFTVPFSKQIFAFNKRHLHGFDCNLDLGLGISWSKVIFQKYEVKMKLGFEQHQYFNQNRIGSSRGDISFTGGVFSLELGF
ncbi:MAG: hypothetical protein H0X29_01305 [Parachlamydiaceae bacterium]|nr:hypothetical protein [Parachlamydiaceae bacterium]